MVVEMAKFEEGATLVVETEKRLDLDCLGFVSFGQLVLELCNSAAFIQMNTIDMAIDKTSPMVWQESSACN